MARISLPDDPPQTRNPARLLMFLLSSLLATGAVFAQDATTERGIGARNDRAFELYSSGELDEAIALAEETLVAARAHLDEASRTRWDSLNNLAHLYRLQQRFDEAESLFSEFLETSRRLFGDRHSATIVALRQLAELHADQGLYEEAEALYLEGLALRREVYGDASPDTIMDIYDLAVLYDSMGHNERADPLFAEQLELTRQLYGDTHPQLMYTLNRQGQRCQNLGRYKEAELLWVECLELGLELFGEEHPDSLINLGNLGELYIELGRFEEAEALTSKCYALRQRMYGDSHPHTLRSHYYIAWLDFVQGRFAAAEPRFIESLEQRRQLLGAAHPDTLQSLNGLAILYKDLGRYSEAEALLEHGVELSLRIHGEADPITVMGLINLGTLRSSQGRLHEARQLAEQCLELRRTSLGASHPLTLICLHDLASLSAAQGRFKEAESLFVTCLEHRQRQLGPEHAETLGSRGSIAAMYLAQGRLSEAESLLLACLDDAQRLFGLTDPNTLALFSELAQLRKLQGRYGEAEELFVQGIALRSEAFGPEHPDTLVNRLSLATLLAERGRYEEAEHLYVENLESLIQALGEHPYTLTGMSDLAVFYSSQGRYEEAELLLSVCHEGRLRLFGLEHPDSLQSLNNLALVYESQGRDEEALSCHQEGLELSLAILGEEHPDSLTSLGNVALMHLRMGRIELAESFAEECLERQRRVLGSEHLDTLRSLNTLGQVYLQQERLEEAEELWSEGVALSRRLLGDVHPATLRSLFSLAHLLEDLGRAAEADSLFLVSSRSAGHWLESTLTGMPRPHRGAFLADNDWADDAVWHVMSAAIQGRVALETAFEQVLWRKGLLLRIATQVERLAALEDSADPQTRQLIAALRQLRQRYANLRCAGSPQGIAGAFEPQELLSLSVQIAELEQQLAWSTRGDRPGLTDWRSLTRRLGQELGEGEALVEIAAYVNKDGAASQLHTWHYAAYVLVGGGSKQLELVDLGPAAVMDAQVTAYRRSLEGRGPVSRVLEREARALYDTLWAPIQRSLGSEVERVCLAPDGQLHLLPFGALMTPDGTWLCEELQLLRIPSARELVSDADAAGEAGTGALVLGSPDYGEITGEQGFASLPGAAREAAAVAALMREAGLPIHQLSGTAASEDSLALMIEASQPGILHLATHGFFLPSERSEARSFESGLQVAVRRPAATGAAAGDPLLQCGLALAGANREATADSDGRLTALEVLGLPLYGTQLVVLSACETGVGEVQNGDGTGSLAEAFLRAGAGKVVMSLWPVGDQATRLLMRRFYELVLDGEEAEVALTRVQREFIASGDPERFAPRAWAGIVLIDGRGGR